MKKNENITILKPVKIFLDDLEKIFEILYSKYDEKDLIIETDDYFFENFEELSRNPDDFIYRLKITVKENAELEINFKDNIYIDSKNRNNLGLILKIKNILSDKKVVKNSFPYYFVKHNRIWFNILSFLVPMILLFIFKDFQKYIIILFFAFVMFYVTWYRLFLIRSAEKILYSTIVLYKKSDILKNEPILKEKNFSRITLIVGIIGTFLPLLIYLIDPIIKLIIEFLKK